MPGWLRRVRGALGMGLTWAIAWAGFGLVLGITSKLVPGLLGWFFEIFDAPVPAMAIPGFIAGAIFSVVLAIAARRKTFHELSLPRVAAWGAIGGLLLSLAPALIIGTGLGTPAEGLNLARLTATIAGPFALMGALCAAGSLRIARMAGSAEKVEPELVASGAAELRPVKDSRKSRV